MVELVNAEVKDVSKDDQTTVPRISGGVVLKILSRLAAIGGCVAVVYGMCQIVDGVYTLKEVGNQIVDGVEKWKEVGCPVQ